MRSSASTSFRHDAITSLICQHSAGTKVWAVTSSCCISSHHRIDNGYFIPEGDAESVDHAPLRPQPARSVLQGCELISVAGNGAGEAALVVFFRRARGRRYVPRMRVFAAALPGTF